MELLGPTCYFAEECECVTLNKFCFYGVLVSFFPSFSAVLGFELRAYTLGWL
jgi:hypothetical protein